MNSNLKFFKNSKTLPVDRFFQNVLYDNKIGYYTTKQPFGKNGDFLTAPKISNLFSEMIGIWLISTWQICGKPKNFNIIELGPGDGSLVENLLKVFRNFPEFEKSSKIYLYETSNYLRNLQKKKY
jgi:NADH dehydrogenase [ubiquinone] 1 alpha subcomplex assembly factor 7